MEPETRQRTKFRCTRQSKPCTSKRTCKRARSLPILRRDTVARCAPGQEQMRAIETYGRNSRVHALRALYAVKKKRLARTGQTERAGRRRPQLHPARGAHEAGRRHEGGRLSNSRHGHHRGKERSREHDRLGQFRPEYDRNRRASARRCS